MNWSDDVVKERREYLDYNGSENIWSGMYCNGANTCIHTQYTTHTLYNIHIYIFTWIMLELAIAGLSTGECMCVCVDGWGAKNWVYNNDVSACTQCTLYSVQQQHDIHTQHKSNIYTHRVLIHI